MDFKKLDRMIMEASRSTICKGSNRLESEEELMLQSRCEGFLLVEFFCSQEVIL